MPVRGHREQWKMTELVIRNFWWPGVMKEVNIQKNVMRAREIRIEQRHPQGN